LTERLDDRAFLGAHDGGGMLDVILSSPERWREGLAWREDMRIALADIEATGVVVCGMGRSGIAGDVLAAIASTRSAIPVVVVKGFDLPAWVGEGALVICVSYSGDTDETVLCAEAAIRSGARVIVIAHGGRLADIAERSGSAHIVPGPAGLMPRAALPSLASAVLAIGERAGCVPDLAELEKDALDALAEGLRMWGPDSPAARNEAKTLAAQIVDRSPAIWGQEGVLAVAAMRFKGQLNENAKMLASWAVVPEALHNEIVAAADAPCIVVLRSATERESIERRIQALGMDNVIEARALGEGDLAVLASAALFGDLVSVYCAALRGVDPTPIEPIRRLKSALG